MIKIKVERDVLIDRLSKVIKFVPKEKAIIPAMENFLIEINKGVMVITASNAVGNASVWCQVSCKDNVSLCVPAALFTSITSFMRENDVEIVIKTERLIEVRSGKSKHKISIDCFPEGFPLIPFGDIVGEFSMNQATLKAGLNGAEQFVDDKNPNENYTGINIAEVDNKIVFTGLNGSLMCRVAMRPISIQSWASIVIHSVTANRVSSLLSDKGEVSVIMSEGKVKFFSGDSNDGFVVVSCEHTIRFPNTEALFKKMPANGITINTLELRGAIKRLSLHSEVINMIMSDEGNIVVTAINTLIDGNCGEEEIIPISKAMSIPLNKSHNAEYMLHALSTIKDNDVIYYYGENGIPSFLIPKVSSQEINMYSYLIACIYTKQPATAQ